MDRIDAPVRCGRSAWSPPTATGGRSPGADAVSASDVIETTTRKLRLRAPRSVHLATGECLRIDDSAFAALVTAGLQPTAVAALADGSAPAVHMLGAVDAAWCEQVAERFARHPETEKEGVTPPIYSLGSHLYSCPTGEADACYFRDIERRNAAIANVLPGGRDPIVSFLKEASGRMGAEFEYLSHQGASVRHGALRLWGAGSQPTGEGRCYFAVPHEDYEETNAAHAVLHQIHGSNNVYSMILCIDAAPDREPETIVWDRRMTLAEICDPGNKHPWANYGFKESLFDGIAALMIKLQKGDAMIIPAHNVHAVIGFPGFRRCTYMAFFHLIRTAGSGVSKLVFRT
jgi:hypothetical protein